MKKLDSLEHVRTVVAVRSSSNLLLSNFVEANLCFTCTLLKKWCDLLYYSDCLTQIAAVWPLGLVSFLIVLLYIF